MPLGIKEREKEGERQKERLYVFKHPG